MNACNFLNNGPIFNPQKVLEALGLLYQMMVEMKGNDGNDEGNDGGNDGGTTVTSVAIRS